MRSTSHLFLTALLVAITTPAITQTTWWGMTANGGTSDIGTIYTITEAGPYAKKYDFTRNDGGDPKCDLVKATDGKYWGVTEFGGDNGVGTIFNYDPATGIYTTVVELVSSTQGARPIGGLIQAANGRLYGMCSEGGSSNLGTIFEYNIGTGVFVRKLDFTGAANGRTPRGRLVQAPNGTMVGVTQLGGANNRGVIFTLSSSGGTYTKRFDFPALGPGNTGAQPFSGLMRPATGNVLYGVTQIGGANSSGVLYAFHSTTFAYTPLYDLNAADGQFPLGELTQAANGLLYGTTTQGGANNAGTIFTWTIGGGFAKVDDLTLAGGYSCYGRMMAASNGLLYGVTNRGGTNDDGVLFSFNPTGDVYTPLAHMNSIGVTDDWAGLIEDPAGTLYGMANDGGAAGSGALIKFVISSGNLSVVLPMALANGSYPKGRLVRASNGLFYGLTSGGGILGAGILFSFNPTGNVFTRLVDLGGANGGSPMGTMVEAGGKLYGVCSNGGASNGGTLFEFNLATNTYTKKIDLTITTGTAPLAGLMKASNGLLYGTCSQGGTSNQGTIFDYQPGTNTFTKRRDLTAADGSLPAADLIEAGGSLWGVCSEGGAIGNGGTLFSFNTTGNIFSKVYDFDAFQGGASPAGELAYNPNGKLYGVCREGGGGLNGSVYSWEIAGAAFLEEHFMLADDSEGKFGEGALILGSNGLHYGTCTQGGTNDLGTLFTYNPTNQAYAVSHHFGSVAGNGHFPFDGLASEVLTSPAIQVSLRAKLEGPFNSGTGLMNDALRTQPTFPLTEPFSGLGFTHVGGGGETIAASVLTPTGTDAIVDWIFVELRLGALPGTIVATRSALVQRDGDIVSTDGLSPLSFALAAGNYRVVVRHRNHLGCMTLNEFALSSAPTSIDLTNGSVPTYGTDALKISSGTYLMWQGNTFLDTPTRMLKYTGVNNDRDKILMVLGGLVPTTTLTGYYQEDCNLDAVVKYTGSFNDRDPILVNIGGTVITNTRAEQLP